MRVLAHLLIFVCVVLVLTVSFTSAQEAEKLVQLDDCAIATPPGYLTQCGFLRVPENRTNPDSRMIDVAFMIVKTRNPNPAPDPLVHLVGGPGGSILGRAANIFGRWFAPFAETRDVILVDQRGTGFSRPRLYCTEYRERFADFIQRYNVDLINMPVQIEILQTCHDRLVDEGVDIGAYNSAENAADIEALRIALGYDQWNLHGVSYGSRLALTLMRDYPSGIRSVVLDSVYPPQLDLYSDIYENMARAFDRLFAACANESTCHTAYPDLEAVFWETYESYNADPLIVTTNDPQLGKLDIAINGDRLVGWVFNWLYALPDIVQTPRYIYELHDRTVGEAINRGLQGEGDIVYLDMGMHYGVQCGEEVRFSDPDDFTTAAQEFPQFADFIAFDTGPANSVVEICSKWQSGPLNPIENEPVVSEIPTLVLAGQFDPVTPPAWAKVAAETLDNSFFYEIPGVGHGAGRSSACGMAISVAFVNEPTTPPDDTCLADALPPAFAVSGE